MRSATSVTSSRIPLNMDTSNTLARHTATTWSGSTAIITASGSQAGFPLRSPHLIGLSPPSSVGIVRAIILSCTTIPTIPDGIWCTTPKLASMCTSSTWVSKALRAQSVLRWEKRRASSHDCSRRFPNQTRNSPRVLCALCVIFSVFSCEVSACQAKDAGPSIASVPARSNSSQTPAACCPATTKARCSSLDRQTISRAL
jgi:hypothetical protein